MLRAVDRLHLDRGPAQGARRGRPDRHGVGSKRMIDTVTTWIDAARRMGVDYLQGFAIGRPEPLPLAA